MKPKLLIVDDNSMLRETTRGILETNFPMMRIFEAEDGKEALAQVHHHLPDLILMDIRLPGDNGILLTRKIKAFHPEIVVIIYTNYDLKEYRDASFKHGADYCFPKTSPSREKLSKMIESILDDTGLIEDND